MGIFPAADSEEDTVTHGFKYRKYSTSSHFAFTSCGGLVAKYKAFYVPKAMYHQLKSRLHPNTR